MGKQVNFYMTGKDEQEFLQFVKTTGDTVILPYTSPSPEFLPVQKVPEPLSGRFWGDFWLFNRSVSSNLVVEFISKQGYYTIDGLQSSVIEFSRSFVKEGILKRGRIWAEITRLDKEKRVLLPKEVEFKEWYEVVAKWIRRRFNRLPSGFYAGPGTLEFRKRGGKLDDDVPVDRGEPPFAVKEL